MIQYIEGNYNVVETENGTKIKTLISETTEEPEQAESLPTMEQIQAQILLNTEYLVCLSEINSL